jgi:hypothetical protein
LRVADLPCCSGHVIAGSVDLRHCERSAAIHPHAAINQNTIKSTSIPYTTVANRYQISSIGKALYDHPEIRFDIQEAGEGFSVTASDVRQFIPDTATLALATCATAQAAMPPDIQPHLAYRMTCA